jgi:hypothetical protein
MAWTYFTGPLSPGDVITRDQRNELLDAFQERLQAAGNVGDGLHADMSDVYGSAISTDRVKYSFRGMSQTAALWELLFDSSFIVQFYDVSSTARTGYTYSSLLAAVASALGVSDTHLTEALSSRVESALRWNAIREGLRLLSIARRPLSLDEVARYTKSGSSNAVWATAKTNFFGATEGSSFLPQANVFASQSSGGLYSISGSRAVMSGTMPSLAIFASGYDVWTYLATSTTNYPGSAAEIAFGGSAATWTPPVSGVAKTAEISGVTLTGSFALEFAPVGYSDSSDLDLYQPAAPGSANNRVLQLTYQGAASDGLRIRPAFTHP